LNKYPKLRDLFEYKIGQGYFENAEVQYVEGATPKAYLYDSNRHLVNQIELVDYGLEELTKVLNEHGFNLQRPPLPEVKDAREKTIGGVHYKFYEKGKHYHKDALDFAQSQSLNGQRGRLLTIQCKALEDQISDWITSISKKPVVWLGATDIAKEGEWRWSYGDVFWSDFDVLGENNPSYFHWSKYEPNNGNHRLRNEHCATMKPYEGWNDVNCDTAAQIIVEFGLKRYNSVCDPEFKETEEDHVDL